MQIAFLILVILGVLLLVAANSRGRDIRPARTDAAYLETDVPDYCEFLEA